jgi:hypothetical protein
MKKTCNCGDRTVKTVCLALCSSNLIKKRQDRMSVCAALPFSVILSLVECSVGWGEERTPTSGEYGEKRWGSFLTPTCISFASLREDFLPAVM